MYKPAPTVYDSGREALIKTFYVKARAETQTYNIASIPRGSKRPQPEIFTGVVHHPSLRYPNEMYRRSIVLRDSTSANSTDDFLIQRLAPPSLEKDQWMTAEAEKGRDFLDALYRQSTTLEPSDGFSFGADPYDRLTFDTLQDGSMSDEIQSVADFCAWFDAFASDLFSYLLLEGTLPEQVRNKLLKRPAEDFPWAERKIDGLAEVCQKFYSTFSVKKGFAYGSDDIWEVDDPTVLINFGDHAILELNDYDCQIELQPLDVVVFKREIKHRFVRHPARVLDGSDPDQRWFVRCEFLQACKRPTEPIDVVERIKMIKRRRTEQQEAASSELQQPSSGPKEPKVPKVRLTKPKKHSQ